jgi:hypothetical protein
MADLIETRWTRYGKDRVYVKTADGVDVGHVDLVSRAVVVKASDHEAELHRCLARWTDTCSETPIEATTLESVADVQLASEPVTVVESRDLAANVAGAAVKAKREEVNAQAPVRNLLARALGVKTEERAWRVGAKGEEKVAKELSKLGDEWRVLHAVEVGEHGSDIDHVVIGPPGVVTINTKCHPDATVWVGERMVMVDGQRTDYLRNSRFEAARASKLLADACGRAVPVRSAIVLVDVADVKVKQFPPDVHVTIRHELVRLLRSMPRALAPDEVESIFAVARIGSIWR